MKWLVIIISGLLGFSVLTGASLQTNPADPPSDELLTMQNIDLLITSMNSTRLDGEQLKQIGQKFEQIAFHPSSQVRFKALSAMLKLGSSEQQRFIIRGLSDSDRRIRNLAIDHINRFIDEESTYHLMQQYFIEMDRELRLKILGQLKERLSGRPAKTQKRVVLNFMDSGLAHQQPERRDQAKQFLGLNPTAAGGKK